MTKLSTLWTTGLGHALALTRGPIARASAISLGIRLVGLALSLLQAILIARLLGPVGYGAVATILSSAQVLATLAMFGLGPMAVRDVPAHKSEGSDSELAAYLRLSITITLVLSCALAAMTVFAVIPALGSAPGFGDKLAFAGIVVIPLALLALLRGWAQGFGRVANAQIPGEVLRPGLMILVMLTAMASGYVFTQRAYLVTAIVAAITAVVLSLALLWRSDLRLLPHPSKSAGLDNTTFAALPFLGLGLASMLQGEINTLLLAALATPEQTGLFQPIARIALLLTLPVQAAGMRYSPRIAELWKSGDHDRLRSITHTFTWTTALVTLALGLAVAICGPWLLLVFGRDFVEGAPLLWIIATAQIFNAACGPIGVIYTMTGRAWMPIIGQLIGLSINIAIGATFIPAYGATAAAFGILAATLAWNLLLVVAMRHQLGLDPSLFGLICKPREIPST